MTASAPVSPLYQYAGVALFRATGYAQQPGIPPWPADGDCEQAGPWREWLLAVWDQQDVARAVTAASPALTESISQLRRGHLPSPVRARRMALSLARYLVRMRGRATPFGLFAGVAPLGFGESAAVTWTGSHLVRARADAAWLTAIITQLEQAPGLRDRLGVVANNMAFVRGDRLIVPWQPHASARTRPAEVSVRHTPAVQLVLSQAAAPRRAGELAGLLATAFDGSAADAAALVAELIGLGVLVTCLRPPATDTDGLGHVLSQLAPDSAIGPADQMPMTAPLSALHAGLKALDPDGRRTGQSMQLAETAMNAAARSPGPPLMIDLRLGATVRLPALVMKEAARAAGALARLSAHPAGNQAWRDYHERFLHRYGADAVVPLGELTDPVAGLGFPAHFYEPAGQETSTAVTGRDEQLLALAQQAALDGEREVTLDDEQIERIAGGAAEGTRFAPHAELCGDLRAPSPSDLDAGAFRLAISGVSSSGVAMAGRFADLLPAADQEHIRRACRKLPAVTDGAVLAQLSFPPAHPHLENVARSPAFLPLVISLAEYPGREPDRIPVTDLAVTSDNGGLYLVWLSRRQVVEPLLASAIARPVMPLLGRLLAEIPRARTAGLSPFAWGTAHCLPFLPRVRYGRSILAPAQWKLPAGNLPGPAAPAAEWATALDKLRDRLELPDYVHAGTGDRQMRLHLDQPMDLAVLRTHLDATPGAVLAEAPSPGDHGWLGGRVHEVVIAVGSTATPACKPRILETTGELPVIRSGQSVLPGADVLFACLYAHPDMFNVILTGHLPGLLASWEQPPPWWFVRYRDPRPHLRFRFHLAGADQYGPDAGRLGAWAAALQQRGLACELSLSTYRPETARYGTRSALAAAEALFAADSAAALAQMAAAAEPDGTALAAVSLADLAAAMTGSWPAGMRWLIEHAPPQRGPGGDRAVVRRAVALAGDGGDSLLAGLPAGSQVSAAWNARREAAARYVALITPGSGHIRADCALWSLLHMHHNRVHGIRPGCEDRCHRTARAVALAWAARHRAAEGRQT